MWKNILIAGGTGRTGQIIVNNLIAQGIHPHIIVRDPAKAATWFGEGAAVHASDIGEVATLLPAMWGMDAVISALGTRTPVGKNCPKRVDYQGIANLIRAAQMAAVKRFVLISSIAVTHPEHPLNRFGRVLEWKFKSEQVLQESGLEYAIVRPGGLTDAPGGKQTLLFGQGDSIRGTLSRADLAEICLAALAHPTPARVSFEAIESDQTGHRDWAKLFASLTPD
jgi:uncharacterized protein YbjT (DUF2867 family)